MFFIFRASEMPFPMFFRGGISKLIKDINTIKYIFLDSSGTPLVKLNLWTVFTVGFAST